MCTTCERAAPLAPGESSRGRRLADAVAEALAAHEGGAALTLRRVSCLNGCPSPCNVALRGQGKYRLRLSRMSSEDAPAVVALAVAYAEHATGNPPRERWPAGLAERLTARAPPPGS